MVYRKPKAVAAAKLREALRDAQHGITRADDRLTTAEYLTDWLELVIRPGRKPATYRAYRSTVLHHLIPHIGHIPLAKLAPDHVQRMLARMDAHAPAKRYARTVLRSALTRAAKHERVMRNAAALADVPPAPKKVPAHFSGDEARRLIAAIRGTRIEAFVLMAIGTGARQGELLALHWDDIDGDTAIIQATMQADGYATTPKTRSSVRETTLPPFVTTALRAHRQAQRLERLAAGSNWQETGLVFTRKDGRPLPMTTVRRNFAAILDEAALPRRQFHALRHSFATLLAEQGEDIGTISKLLGHASVATTADIYSHLTSKTRRRVAADLDVVLTG